MTQINNLRQIDGASTLFRIAKDAVWTWSIPFPYPAGPQVPLLAAAAMTVGSVVLSGLSPATVAALVTGQPVAGYGIPDGATIAGFPDTASVRLSVPVTQAGGQVGVTFQPLPLDLTGISFRMQVKQSMSSSDGYSFLDLTTDNGLLLNSGPHGVLSAVVPQPRVAASGLSQDGSPYVADLIAWALDGGPVNLMALSGPATVEVIEGVTRQ